MYLFLKGGEMVGLDRAGVWVRLDVDTDLAILGVLKEFPDAKPRKLAGATQTFIIKKENLNEIKIKENSGKTIIKIDFSYSRHEKENNLFPLENEFSKIIVEEKLVETLKKITLEEVKRTQLNYEYLEVCIQERVPSFYAYHNIISTFYKGLKREYQKNDSLRYENYDIKRDYYYSTGFTFQINTGWKVRLYSKSHEHNKKNPDNKVLGANIRLEHILSGSAIKFFCKTSKVADVTIGVLQEMFLKKINKNLFEIFEKEVFRDIEILKEKFKNYTSRTLSSLVRDYQENILDEKIINNIISDVEKSQRQIIRYRNKVKENLQEFQNRGSPKRENFGNIERMEIFINKILLFDIKVKCSYNEPLTFEYAKK